MAARRLPRRLAEVFEVATVAPPAMSPELGEAFERAQVVPEEMPPEDTPAPKTRLDMVREYLERTRTPQQAPVVGPEADVARAAQSDAVRDFGDAMLRAGAAFRGDQGALLGRRLTNAQESAALASNEARQRALRDWAMSQERSRLGEAELLSRAAAEPGKKDPELEKRRLDLLERETARREGTSEQELLLKREKFEAEERRRRAGAGAGKGKADEKAKAAGFKSAMELRKEFNALPEVKNFKDVDVAYRKIQTAAQNVSAAGDLSLIFGYMKMLDPGSTVREGEFANAQNAGGVDDKIRAAYNNVTQGQRLTDSQRADFLRQAQGVYTAQQSRFQESADMYRTLAQKGGLDPDDVVSLKKPTKKDDAPSGDVTMVGPDGIEVDVEAGKVEMFRKRGFKER